MAVDTPARIAVLGAGPLGLEAALYARFLGYDVDLYERGRVAENVWRWGHVRMFSPFYLNCSPLGLAALRAQDPSYEPPADDALLTGREFVERYLYPLSQTDLLADHLRLGTTVLAVTHPDLLKGELIGDEERGDYDFQILSCDEQGRESVHSAEAVIDTTGVYSQANWMGQGGAPAIGERGLRDRIEYGVPDVLGTAREHYANQHVLVIGSGYSAATTVVALARLAESAEATRVTWVTRRGAAGVGPIALIADDRLSERKALATAANRLVEVSSPIVQYLPGTSVAAVMAHDETGKFQVNLTGAAAGCYEFDRIVANVGYRPDNRLYQELQVHECYASGGPMKLAAALLKNESPDCLDQHSPGPASLLNPEPDFYILGAKSYGRNSNFLLQAGLQQIRDLFTIIGDRADLDLYANAMTKSQ